MAVAMFALFIVGRTLFTLSFSVLKFYTELILNLNSSRELILQGHIEEKGDMFKKRKE